MYLMVAFTERPNCWKTEGGKVYNIISSSLKKASWTECCVLCNLWLLLPRLLELREGLTLHTMFSCVWCFVTNVVVKSNPSLRHESLQKKSCPQWSVFQMSKIPEIAFFWFVNIKLDRRPHTHQMTRARHRNGGTLWYVYWHVWTSLARGGKKSPLC